MAYQYTGFQPMGFPDYRDLVTQQMLMTQPGGIYQIGAVDAGKPVPPAGGLFTEVHDDTSDDEPATVTPAEKDEDD